VTAVSAMSCSLFLGLDREPAATLIAFVIGLTAVARLPRFLMRHSMYWFAGYQVVAGVAVLILPGNGTVAAT
jgi:undecaprenyl-diphosphatase